MRILRKLTESLACKLTEEEFRARAESLAATLENIRAEESRQEMLKRQMKSSSAALEAERDRLSLIVSRGEEIRLIEVEEHADDKKLMVSRIRMDTGEVMLERRMTSDEKQQKLPLPKAEAVPVGESVPLEGGA